MTPTFDGCGANKSPTGEQQSFRLTTLMSTKARPSPLIRLSRVVDTTQRYGERIRGQPRPSGLWFCDRGEADYPVSSAKLFENTYWVRSQLQGTITSRRIILALWYDVDGVWTDTKTGKWCLVDDRCWSPLPSQVASLVNSPNSIMRFARLSSPFTIFLVLVFALLVSAGKGKKKGKSAAKAPLDVIPEESVSDSPYQECNKSWSMIQDPEVRYSLHIYISWSTDVMIMQAASCWTGKLFFCEDSKQVLMSGFPRSQHRM